MRALVLPAIGLYQRYVSPRKGFCCAYRHHLGRFSCSILGCRAIRRHGVVRGLAILRARLALCRRVHEEAGTRSRQRGSAPCDLPCDGTPGAGCASLDADCGRAGRYVSCCDAAAGCDWPRRDRKKSDEQDRRHVPPRSSRVQRQ